MLKNPRTRSKLWNALWVGALALVLVPSGALAAAPQVRFTSPSDGARLPADRFDADRGRWYADVRIATFARDAEDGIVPSGRTSIYDSMNGAPARLMGTGVIEHARLYVDCNDGESARHDLTARVRDSSGHVGTAHIRVWVRTLC